MPLRIDNPQTDVLAIIILKNYSTEYLSINLADCIGLDNCWCLTITSILIACSEHLLKLDNGNDIQNKLKLTYYTLLECTYSIMCSQANIIIKFQTFHWLYVEYEGHMILTEYPTLPDVLLELQSWYHIHVY